MEGKTNSSLIILLCWLRVRNLSDRDPEDLFRESGFKSGSHMMSRLPLQNNNHPCTFLLSKVILNILLEELKETSLGAGVK